MTITQFEAMIIARTDGSQNPVSTERQLWAAVKNNAFILYEVKELDVPAADFAAFLNTHFDGTGLGKEAGNFFGFAICNGQNNTRNRGGRTSIGYDATDYGTIGATGGAKTHALSVAELAAHKHKLVSNENRGVNPSSSANSITPNNNNSSIAAGTSNGGDNDYRLVEGTQAASAGDSGEAGSGTAHNNMQPYIVTLFIQRVA